MDIVAGMGKRGSERALVYWDKDTCVYKMAAGGIRV